MFSKSVDFVLVALLSSFSFSNLIFAMDAPVEENKIPQELQGEGHRFTRSQEKLGNLYAEVLRQHDQTGEPIAKILESLIDEHFPCDVHLTPRTLSDFLNLIYGHFGPADASAKDKLARKLFTRSWQYLGQYTPKDFALALTQMDLNILRRMDFRAIKRFRAELKDWIRANEGRDVAGFKPHDLTNGFYMAGANFNRNMAFIKLLIALDPEMFIPFFVDVLIELDALQNVQGLATVYNSLYHSSKLHSGILTPKKIKFLEEIYNRVGVGNKFEYKSAPNIPKYYTVVADLKRMDELNFDLVTPITGLGNAHRNLSKYELKAKPELVEFFEKMPDFQFNIQEAVEAMMDLHVSMKKNAKKQSKTDGGVGIEPALIDQYSPEKFSLEKCETEDLIQFTRCNRGDEKNLLKYFLCGFYNGNKICDVLKLVRNKPSVLSILLGIKSDCAKVIIDNMEKPKIPVALPAQNHPTNKSPNKAPITTSDGAPKKAVTIVENENPKNTIAPIAVPENPKKGFTGSSSSPRKKKSLFGKIKLDSANPHGASDSLILIQKNRPENTDPDVDREENPQPVPEFCFTLPKSIEAASPGVQKGENPQPAPELLSTLKNNLEITQVESNSPVLELENSNEDMFGKFDDIFGTLDKVTSSIQLKPRSATLHFSEEPGPACTKSSDTDDGDCATLKKKVVVFEDSISGSKRESLEDSKNLVSSRRNSEEKKLLAIGTGGTRKISTDRRKHRSRSANHVPGKLVENFENVDDVEIKISLLDLGPQELNVCNPQPANLDSARTSSGESSSKLESSDDPEVEGHIGRKTSDPEKAEVIPGRIKRDKRILSNARRKKTDDGANP